MTFRAQIGQLEAPMSSLKAQMGQLRAQMCQFGAKMGQVGAQKGQLGAQMGQWGLKWANLGFKWANSTLQCANLVLKYANLQVRWPTGGLDGSTQSSNEPTQSTYIHSCYLTFPVNTVCKILIFVLCLHTIPSIKQRAAINESSRTISLIMSL